MLNTCVRLIALTSLAAAVSLVVRMPSFAQVSKTCTVITNSGKEYIGCKSNGYEYNLARPVHGITSFSAAKENAHNPGCFDVRANGVIAICTYMR